MKYIAIRLYAIIFLSVVLSGNLYAQPENEPANPPRKEARPYKILTNGKQVTVRSSKNIRNIMVWTASGHRVVEQKDINAATYSFNVSGMRDKAFFLMIQYDNAKPFTEKIGVQ